MAPHAKATNGASVSLTADESHEPPEQQGFSHFIAICFTVNYLIGTGFLTIPWAFERGGVILSLATLMVVVVVSNITKNYLLSAMALAEALTVSGTLDSAICSSRLMISMSPQNENGYGSADEADHRIKSDDSRQEQEQGGLNAVVDEECNGDKAIVDDRDDKLLALDKADENRNGVPYHTERIEQQHAQELALVRERKFEVIDLCRMYLGEIGKKALIFSVALDVYFELWAFVSVFASSSARQLPLAKNFERDYFLYSTPASLQQLWCRFHVSN